MKKESNRHANKLKYKEKDNQQKNKRVAPRKNTRSKNKQNLNNIIKTGEDDLDDDYDFWGD